MNQETKQCKKCNKEFLIEPEDFDFYERIKVSAPTWCPDCRMQRKMLWRNERSLYKRKCDLCNKDIISAYPDNVDFPVYCVDCWVSDKWDGVKYGQDYDFNKPFFEQFHSLIKNVPRRALEGHQNENSPYTNYTWYCKSTYLCPSTLYSENITHSKGIDRCKDCLDCAYLTDSELCYQALDSIKCYSSKNLIKCRDCLNSSFLFDCINCQNCFMSFNLRNKQYVIENKQYTKEEYEDRLKQLFKGNYSETIELIDRFKNLISTKAIHRFANVLKSVNSSGNNITNAKNAKNCFDVYNVENMKYCWRAFDVKDSMDCYGAGDKAELLYEGIDVGNKDSMIAFCSGSYLNSTDVRYCDYCRSCSDIFGCAGLKKKQYCILNKQYTKEEYMELVPKVIEHMDKQPYIDKKERIYKYGEFFPSEISPLIYYNETIAQEFFPLTKEQALEQGFIWKDSELKDIQPTKKTQDLPENIKDVDDSITKEIIECEHQGKCNEQCTTAFKIIPQELEFYRKMNLPLPRLCPNCRYYQRLKKRNPLKLWKRKCANCNVDIETTYSPDRPEIVYCEDCYKREVI